jgi:lactoylglutathione lyase
MEILGLRTVIYKVSDIKKAKKWYSDAFGVEPYFDQPFYIGYNIGGYELGLQPEEAFSAKGDNVTAYWGVVDVTTEHKRLLGFGAREHEAPQNVGSDIIVSTVKDPWNNVIGLIHNPHFKLL